MRALLLVLITCSTAFSASPLREALLLHALFDQSADADVAAGDKRLFTAVPKQPAQPGLHRADVSIVPDGGRFGGALRFGAAKGPTLFYTGAKNAPFAERDFAGSFSVWVKVDPDRDLPGYCDLVQITDKSPLDEGIFAEFTKDAPRKFRMVAAPSKAIWNPQNRKYEEMPLAERPLLEVPAGDFGGDKWTHIVVTWTGFNDGENGGKSGVATLYINGSPRGALTGWNQTYHWDAAKTQIKIGLGLVGLLDDLALFSRALTADEVKTLHGLEGGVKALR
jgi:hypothetical protein